MTSMPGDPDPDLAAADQQRITELLSAAQAPAPASLQLAIGGLATAGAPAGRRRRRQRPLLGLAVGFAAGVVLAVLLSATPQPPSALRVSVVALERSTRPAPLRLIAAGTAIAFPQWSLRGWPSTGMRSDSLGGRAVTTEFYGAYSGGTLGYAIVAGAPLHWGAGGHSVTSAGERYWLTVHDGAAVVAWIQDGHTCVLASRSVPQTTLLSLAADERGATPA
jgi:hypothetical protein